ncbi:hypothetical protein ACGFJT_24480 [Actinomadura geliboluensis]|uniref:hypothetical protein n=1 Tax=Actinomadura geliboluensis TaxID=882440 RepID=UPI0037135F6E
MSDPLADWTAITAAFRPLLATGRLARYRVLDVACPNGHRLAQIIATPRGPVICSRSEAVTLDHTGRPIGWQRRAVHDVIPLDLWPRPTYTAQCRCRTARLTVPWLRAQLDTGTHRAVWTQPEGHTP